MKTLLALGFWAPAWPAAQQSATSADSAEALKQWNIVVAAAAAAEQRNASMRCRFEYRRDRWNSATETVAERQLKGHLAWQGRQVAYVVRNAGDVALVAACAHDATLRTVAYELPDGRMTFRISVPPADIDAALYDETESHSAVDPIVHFAGGISFLASNMSLVRSVSALPSKDGFALRIERKSGGRIDIDVSAAHDFLPVRLAVYSSFRDSLVLGYEESFSWKRVAGAVALAAYSRSTTEKLGGRPRALRKTLKFTDHQFGLRIGAEEFSPDALPIPEGCVGVDKLWNPARGMVRHLGKLAAIESVRLPTAATEESAAISAAADRVAADQARWNRTKHYLTRGAVAAGAAALFAAAAWSYCRWRLR